MAAEYFLKITDVDGESTKAGLEGYIEIQSWSWGETNAGSFSHGMGGGTGKVTMQDFSFSMTQNKASPTLLLSCATGQHHKEATLKCRKAGGDQQIYLTIKFTDLLVSSYQTGGDQGVDHLPVDHISFNYTRIDVEYKPQKADGTLEASGVKVGYDLKLMKKT